MSDTQAEAARRRALPVLYLIVFLDLLGFGILLPSLPYWARELGASGFELGLLLASYSVAQFFGSPLFGRMSDRIGRRPVLLWSLVGSVLTLLLCAAAPSLLALTAARFLAGFFAATIGTAQAAIVDLVPEEERTRSLGLLGASIGMGFVLGPGLGAMVNALGYGFRGAALVAAGLAALTLVFGWFRLVESKRAVQPRPMGLARLRAPRALRSVFICNFLLTGVFVVFETTFAFLGQDRFMLDEVGFGLVMFGVGLVMVWVQGRLVGQLSRHYQPQRIALAGSALLTLAVLLVPFASSWGLLAPTLVVLGVGRGLTSPTLASVVSSVAADGEAGAHLGALQAWAAAARATFPMLAGWAYDVGPSAPYFGAAVLSTGALFLLFRPGGNRDLDELVAVRRGTEPDGVRG